jgi:hypothetical protein
MRPTHHSDTTNLTPMVEPMSIFGHSFAIPNTASTIASWNLSVS